MQRPRLIGWGALPSFNLMNQPTLESFGLRLARAKDEGIQARFGDNIQFERNACAGITLRITEGNLFIIKAAKCFRGVSDNLRCGFKIKLTPFSTAQLHRTHKDEGKHFQRKAN